MTALACAALAAAVGCLPAPVGTARFAALWPVPGPGRRWRPGITAPAVLGGLLGLLAAGPGGALGGAVVAVTVGRRTARRRRGATAQATAGELADAVARITEELRAGSHPAAALAGVRADGPRARALLSAAASAARLGDGVPAALRRGAGGHPAVAADVERVAVAWALAERHGIPLTELLARAGEDIRWRLRFGATVRAQLAGPRATATVLTGLPVLGLLLGQLVGADPVGVLRGGVLGQGLLVAGVGLAAAGAAWCEHILRVAVPR